METRSPDPPPPTRWTPPGAGSELSTGSFPPLSAAACSLGRPPLGSLALFPVCDLWLLCLTGPKLPPGAHYRWGSWPPTEEALVLTVIYRGFPDAPPSNELSPCSSSGAGGPEPRSQVPCRPVLGSSGDGHWSDSPGAAALCPGSSRVSSPCTAAGPRVKPLQRPDSLLLPPGACVFVGVSGWL